MCQLLLRCPEKLVDANVMEFIIAYGKPHKAASSVTISQCIKNEFCKAGINANVYTAQSCRAASSSKTKDNGVSITEILKRACWKSENTFRTFYSRYIISKDSREDFDFVQALLSSSETTYDKE